MTEVRLTGIAHAVFFVSDAARIADFYSSIFGFVRVDSLGPGSIFLRLEGSDEHFDLGLVELGIPGQSPSSEDRLGLYHLGWAVSSAADLVVAKQRFEAIDAFTGASDHGTHVSVYGKDPDQNELEILWRRPLQATQVPGMTVRPVEWDALVIEGKE